MPLVARGTPEAPPDLRFGQLEMHRAGEGVLVGVIDVQGFDFSHPDFLDDRGNTRFARIWDQGGVNRPPPAGAAFDYGSELKKEHLDRALAEARKRRVVAYELEPQSQMVEGAHGTHVASIAAGNHGICHRAVLAGVLVSMPPDELDRRASFYDSTRIVDAFDYLIRLKDELGLSALVVNVSLGTNGHAHDGSNAPSRWLDADLLTEGRAVCVAAGNAGQEKAAFEGDLGWIMGRIHTSGRIPARGLALDLEWLVVGNGIEDVSENELEIWYSAQDEVKVSVRPPGPSAAWTPAIRPKQFIERHRFADGTSLSIYSEPYHPANGANLISIYLTPLRSREGVKGVAAGKWTVRLEGEDVKDGFFHAWIERDDARRVGRIGDRELWNFPSFFSERCARDDTSVTSLACGDRIISVGNLDAEVECINPSSSQGPTRDGRFKPDISAPGTRIVAAKGFARPGDGWVAMTGTSMASPFVAGVVGLMLAISPRLTAAQIAAILRRTARPLPGSDYAWKNDAGYGAVDPERALAEAASVWQREEIRL